MEDFELGTSVQETDPRVAQSKTIALYGVIFSLIFAAFSIGTLLSSTNSATEAGLSDYVSENLFDDSWAPSGFNVWSDNSNIAYRWALKNNCDNYGCVQAEFISKDGCPNSFYAAVNWLDSNDSVISYDNSTLPSLSSMQIAKLRFDDIEGSSETAQMAEISCR